MQIIKHINKLEAILDEKRKAGSTVGFVPTMGALHSGHLSLVDIASQQTDYIVVSIFVNPTQFNDKGDLERYPRDLQKDVEMLGTTACHLVFAPDPEEIYPEPDTRKFNFGALENVMEGKFRPGHFNGVAQVVSRLFDVVKPNKAFFGQKDFQQLAVIREMVRQLNLPVEIISCPIVRESDGLAMSSRNMLLEKKQRENAAHISATLNEAQNKKDELSVDELCDWVINRINENQYLNTEYYEIVDELTLQPAPHWDYLKVQVGCIAVFCGKVRLIDNVVFR